MNKVYALLFYCLLVTYYVSGMNVDRIPEGVPQDVSEFIVYHQLCDIHNQVTTLQEARDYLVSVSLVNTYCNQMANDPLLIRTIIRNLSAILRSANGCIYYESSVAANLDTPATRKYKEINTQLFCNGHTRESVELLLQQGAEPNYRRSLAWDYVGYDETKYERERHYYSQTPLRFFASGTTEDDLEIVRCLLEHGADQNKGAWWHGAPADYPLGIAIKLRLPKMVSLLLEYKPVFADSQTELSYLTQAIELGYSEIVDMLKYCPNADFRRALTLVIAKNNIPLLTDLLSCGAAPEKILAEVVTKTLLFPDNCSGNESACWVPTQQTTEVLQLLCQHGIQDQQLLEESIARAKETKRRAKEVIELLKTARK